MEAQTNVSDAAVKAVLAVARGVLTNMLNGSHLSRCARAAKPESLDGSRDKAEQFI